MGLLNRRKGEEPDSSEHLEELYEKLFPKIGRDFVYRDDLYRILESFLFKLDPSGQLAIDFMSDTEARSKALEYKDVLESGRDGRKIYQDLINLDEE